MRTHGLVVTTVVLCLLAGCASHKPRWVRLVPVPETIRAATDDGTELALHHFPPVGEAVSTTPVLVCHGIASNRHTWTLGADRSIGAYLSKQGYDVYLVDLRGHGESGPATPGTNIDTYGQHDVPAAITAALQHSGAEQAVWIGHSMGGMSLVAYLDAVDETPLAAAVTVASPIDWRGSDRMTHLVEQLLVLFPGQHPLQTKGLARIFTSAAGDMPFGLDRMVYEPSNMTREHLADMMRVGISPIQGGVRSQFKGALQAGAFVSADGGTNYLDTAAKVQVPFLVIAGRADHLSPPERTWDFYDRLASPDKTWRVFGLDQGDHADYGHVDLCNGNHAQEDVYPFISEWLRSRIGGE